MQFQQVKLKWVGGRGPLKMSKHREVIEKLFRIYNKDDILVDFRLNKSQQLIDDAMDQNPRNSILKPRQKGCSVYVMARYLVDCMNEHVTAVMLAHDKDHTEKLLRKAQQFLINMKGPKPKTSRTNENEIYFDRTQSSFYIGTAGSKNFGRSATITRLHMSELAFWKDPKGIRTGLMQAVPNSGQVVEETTANGYGTWYQKYYYRLSSMPTGRVRPIFFNWLIDREYTSQTPFQYPLTDDEVEIMANYPECTVEHLQWRREKLEELDGDIALFKQEYPLSMAEAFNFTGGTLFPDLELAESTDWQPDGTGGYILNGHPNPNYLYSLGADSSGGTGNDEAAIAVLCMDTMEQVYEWGHNRKAAPSFAPIVDKVGKMFNAYLVPEANSHGLATLDILKSTYGIGKIFRRSVSPRKSPSEISIPSIKYGWETTARTKAYAIGVAQKLSQEGLKVYSPEGFSQLKAFTEDEDTHQIINSGDHDDRGMAILLAGLGLQKLIREGAWDRDTPEKSYEERLAEVKKVINMKDWRDKNGIYMLKFEDMFKKSKKRNIHL